MAKKVLRKFSDYKDLGFGSKVAAQGDRFINRDGTFNVEKKGVSVLKRFSFYHAMINMSWWKFILIILSTYCIINVLFACLYLLIGFENLSGTTAETHMGRFFEAFFFSAQTFTTVGYGRINPVGLLANFVVVFELLLGLLSLALATGLFYARSSRPVGKILFSQQMLVAPYRGISALMIRIANAQDNQLIEMEVQIVLSRIEEEEPGQRIRKFYQLPLERDKINFLSLSWTIVHPMDETSPLYGCTEADLKNGEVEFMVLIKGFDDTYFQNIYVRSSYKYHEMVWGARFIHTYDRSASGKTVLNLSTLGACERAELPVSDQVVKAQELRDRPEKS
jgi:inward rectifier potassium channel